MSDKKFKGFQQGGATISIHAQFFNDVLPHIDDLDELKILLFCYRALLQKLGKYRYLQRRDFAGDDALIAGLSGADALDSALDKAVDHAYLLRVTLALNGSDEAYYFMNTTRGRTAVSQIEQGNWSPAENKQIEILPERPNIYTLYEENIGVLTPRIAEHLRDAEGDYPYDWVIDAIHAAVDNNVRRWKYIHAILERWQQEGRVDETDRRPDEPTRRDFTGGEFADYIES